MVLCYNIVKAILGGNNMNIDWSNKDWSYLLGVVHGDGNVSTRSIRVSVSYKDKEYANTITELWDKLGYDPKVYRPRTALAIDVHNSILTNELRKYKFNGKWALPAGLDKNHWMAGIIDTDGTVTIASKKCAVIITLKRSGNLEHVRDALGEIGICGVNIHNRISKFRGKEYEVEEMRLTSFDKILQFNKYVPLRHPRKLLRLKNIIQHIEDAKARIPLWEQVGIWLQDNEPQTWEEIANKFNLTKDQFDSVIQNLKRHASIQVLPPPKSLSRYKMKGWKK